ncbi:hypothetical protein PR048_013914 [Dryococelus australis]|uniref:Uncharacterized protein n=1 Tax=Dryococelus australis TaxID=614101 RepID=A0ABQ9HTN7_9NEOP|nr:hypothetical protein PR048_013914 [Dryococelus australis]
MRSQETSIVVAKQTFNQLRRQVGQRKVTELQSCVRVTRLRELFSSPEAEKCAGDKDCTVTRNKCAIAATRRAVFSRPARLPPRRTGFNPRPGHYRIFASGNRAGRCRWSAGFLGDLRFPTPFHSRRRSMRTSLALICSEASSRLLGKLFELAEALRTDSSVTCDQIAGTRR